MQTIDFIHPEDAAALEALQKIPVLFRKYPDATNNIFAQIVFRISTSQSELKEQNKSPFGAYV